MMQKPFKSLVLSLSLIISLGKPLAAQQLGTYLGDETAFYAANKQLNQFFRRFNNEEDRNGKAYSSKDKLYREVEQRKKYLPLLFDMENYALGSALKNEFIQAVTQKDTPQFLEFLGGRWFAEVRANFWHNGKTENVNLFLELQKEGLGSKWVLFNVYFKPFNSLFLEDTVGASKSFLHPQSHEIDFMNLNKIFQETGNVELYAKREYRPDYVSIFFYEMKKNNMRFETITEVKFHFFQIKDWYFEVSNFNRAGNNSGWLISNMTKVSEAQKSILEKYIFTKR